LALLSMARVMEGAMSFMRSAISISNTSNRNVGFSIPKEINRSLGKKPLN
jgi:hypothetical protein